MPGLSSSNSVLLTCGVTLTIFLCPCETTRGPMTLTNDLRFGDDHSTERYSQKIVASANDVPIKRSSLRTITGPADPKEQRSWLELSPQITMTGPADPKEQPLTNCR
jgi:hypothetical protein